ncbi:epimerase/dehydratase [Pseudozyma hubeiensis SY62]|uniref:Epimerase/dehydratase n=1 Tax=Pseudozyma hubeiensis (strain SY62) TaxID=1305764 RepID=R9P001_PSEHS|nr:epimerase/dehydratase [Pseudozyma hubeiensis SY62]GAC94426.1 epimerase/dehydratase [Pseudozyma hubeiensis SY62]
MRDCCTPTNARICITMSTSQQCIRPTEAVLLRLSPKHAYEEDHTTEEHNGVLGGQIQSDLIPSPRANPSRAAKLQNLGCSPNPRQNPSNSRILVYHSTYRPNIQPQQLVSFFFDMPEGISVPRIISPVQIPCGTKPTSTRDLCRCENVPFACVKRPQHRTVAWRRCKLPCVSLDVWMNG